MVGYSLNNCFIEVKVFDNVEGVYFSFNEMFVSVMVKFLNMYFVGLVDQLLGCDL